MKPNHRVCVRFKALNKKIIVLSTVGFMQYIPSLTITYLLLEDYSRVLSKMYNTNLNIVSTLACTSFRRNRSHYIWFSHTSTTVSVVLATVEFQALLSSPLSVKPHRSLEHYVRKFSLTQNKQVYLRSTALYMGIACIFHCRLCMTQFCSNVCKIFFLSLINW